MKFWQDMNEGTASDDKILMIGDPVSGLPQIIRIKDFLKSIATKNEIYVSNIGIINYSMPIDGFNIDFTNRKFIKKAGGYSIVKSGLPYSILHHPSGTSNGNEAYETDFMGTSTNTIEVWFLVFNKQEEKIYVVHFGSASNLQMFDAAGNYLWIPLGTFSYVNGKFTSTIKADLCFNGRLYTYNTLNKDVNYMRESNLGYNFYNYQDKDGSPVNVDWSSRKVIVKAGRIFGYLGENSRLDSTFTAHETDIVNPVNNYNGVHYLIYDTRDKKFYIKYFDGAEGIAGYPVLDRGFIHILGAGGIGANTEAQVIATFSTKIPVRINGELYTPIAKRTVSIDDAGFIAKVKTENLVNPDARKTNQYYSSLADFLAGTLTTSTTYGITDIIPVEAGKSYKRANIASSYWWYIYDAERKPVKILGPGETLPPNGIYTPTEDGFIASVISAGDAGALSMITESDVDTSSYIPYYIYKLDDQIKVDAVSTENDVNTFDNNDVGCLDYQEIGSEGDYSQIVMYGQSLSMGWEAPEAITTQNIPGNFMVGDKVAIRHGNNGQNVLNPLVSTMATSCGENPTVAVVNSFSMLWRRFKDKNTQFIATSCGEGGQSIERLSKECTNGTNYYTAEFLNALNRTKASVDTLGKKVECNAILYMQGEHNYTGTGLGLTPGTEATRDKDEYKAYLLQLKNNMQADIMATYGQNKKPLFFICQVAGSYINRLDMSINMAQLEFARENPDVFLLNPTYGTPDYNGGHLSTNGYRWYGELIAKSLYNVFVKGERFRPITPHKFTVSANTLKIDFYVPRMPLVLDTWTKESIANYGFRVFADGAEVATNGIKINNNSIVIYCAKELKGTVEITYAGQGRSGSGNLRDSDTWVSKYTYYDDRVTSPSKRENYTPKDKDGNLIYGLPYPMYNWCSNFYKKIEI